MHSLGIVGGGVLGSAHARVFQNFADVKVYDCIPERATHSFEEVAAQEIVLICLPTPMAKDGRADASLVAGNVIRVKEAGQARAVVVRSTTPPHVLAKLDAIPGPRLMFSPEFLTERSATYDLQQTSHFIVGCSDRYSKGCDAFAALIRSRFPEVPIHWTSLEAAALVKYFTNTFFACKVALFNEFDSAAKGYGVDGAELTGLMMLDPRIGRSHFQVPGHDGRRGFGGSCFLKDINAYRHIAGGPSWMAQAAWRVNMKERGAQAVADELAKLLGRSSCEPMTAQDVERLMR